MTPSRNSLIRGILEKRNNKEILESVSGSVWLFHIDDLNPG